MIIFLLFAAAILERVAFDLGPNVELVTAAMVLASLYVSRKSSLYLTLSILVISDLIIRNSNIFLFTWSGFLVPILFIKYFKNFKSSGVLAKIGLATGIGITANLFFFLWTNFGVWLLESGGMYTNDVAGLILSYTRALPFLKLQLMSTITFVPTLIAAIEVGHYFSLVFRQRPNESGDAENLGIFPY